MTNWQKNRNYRRIRQADGSIKNIIIVDGQKVEVTYEVYKAYSQMDRRERYLDELDSQETILSIEKMVEDGVSPDKYTIECFVSAEDALIDAMDAIEHEEMLMALRNAIDTLTDAEKDLIQAIYYDGISAREYARRQGVYPRTVMYRLEKLHEKLRQKIKI